MLGVGNGFSKGVYDNNALLGHHGRLAMIDCGTTAWLSLDQLGIAREAIDEIFLTHLHFDHSGGVESAALYGRYIAGKKPTLIVPRPIERRLWEHTLKGTIEDKEQNLLQLKDYFNVVAPAEQEPFYICGAKAYWVQTKHVPGKFSCGLVLADKLFYTSDMVCDPELLDRMMAGGIEMIYHDCQLNNAKVHADFATLCTYPEHLQKKIWLMHHGLGSKTDVPRSGKMRFLFQHETMHLW